MLQLFTSTLRFCSLSQDGPKVEDIHIQPFGASNLAENNFTMPSSCEGFDAQIVMEEKQKIVQEKILTLHENDALLNTECRVALLSKAERRSVTAIDAQKMKWVHLVDLWIGLEDFRNVREIQLQGSEIVSIPIGFSSLKKLEFLGLSRTPLQTLSKRTLGHLPLKEIYLERSLITEFPPFLTKMTTLKVINVIGTAINSIPIEMCSLPNLVKPSIRHSNFVSKLENQEEFGRFFSTCIKVPTIAEHLGKQVAGDLFRHQYLLSNEKESLKNASLHYEKLLNKMKDIFEQQHTAIVDYQYNERVYQTIIASVSACAILSLSALYCTLPKNSIGSICAKPKRKKTFRRR